MSLITYAPVTHCIFDVDGLLLDTEPIYESVVRDICKMFGKPYPMQTRLRILGTTEQMTGEIAIRDMKLPISPAEFHIIYKDLSQKRLVNLSLMPGVERLLRHLHEHNVPTALATSCGEFLGLLKMSAHTELFSLFRHKVYGSTDPEVIIGKPAPDIFLVAAKRFPEQPTGKNCLVFEDAPNGVRAAVLAGGMQTVMVPEKYVTEDLRQEATIVLNSLEDFRPEIFGLPPFKAFVVPKRNVIAC